VVGCICLLLPLPRRPSPSPAHGSASPNRPAKRLRAAGVSRSSLFLTLPGRAVARTGLRMMPTFPPLPLKSRTAGFPQYGFKADISDGAFPFDYEFVASHGLPPSFVHLATCNVGASICVEGRGALVHHRSNGHRRFTPGALAPAELCCLGHQRLTGPMRPTRQRTPISPTRFIRGALAVRPHCDA
jgi:hypothetical protein